MSEHEHHHHHHEISVDAVKGRAFFFGIILNTLFVIGEFTAGFIFNSMGLSSENSPPDLFSIPWGFLPMRDIILETSVV